MRCNYKSKTQLCRNVTCNTEAVFVKSFFSSSVLAALGLSIDSSLLSVAIYQSKPEAHILADKNLNFHTDRQADPWELGTYC